MQLIESNHFWIGEQLYLHVYVANLWVSVPCTANMDLRPKNAWKDLDYVQNYDSALVLIPFLRSPSPFCPQIDMKAY